MLPYHRISFTFLLAKETEGGDIGIFRLDGLMHPPVKIQEVPSGDIRRAKAALIECAETAAGRLSARVVEMPLHLKYRGQFEDWARRVQVLTSRTWTLVHG